MNEIYKTNILKKIDSKGKLRYWVGIILLEEGKYYTRQEYWGTKDDGSDAAHVFSDPVLIEQKNIGKSNETSLYKQSMLEITSLFKKKLDEGYFEIEQESNDIFLPMLAQSFNKKRLIFPGYIQPKLDGCFHYDTLISTSKGLLKIGDIIDKELDVEVLSYNELLNIFEYKPIKRRFDNGRSHFSEWVEITVDNRIFIKATSNHKFYTQRGWIEAQCLDEDKDKLFANNKESYQNSLLVGTILGDSICAIDKRCSGISYRIVFSHSNKELFDYKVRVLGLEGKVTEYVSGYGKNCWRFVSNCLSKSSFPLEYFYHVEGEFKGKRKVIDSKKLRELLTLESLSLWIADDGSLSFNNGNKVSPRLSLSTYRYSIEQLEEFKIYFEEVWNCSPSIYKDSRISSDTMSGCCLTFNSKDTIYLLSLIRHLHCKGVEYKYYFNSEGYIKEVEDNFQWLSFKLRKARFHSGLIRKFDIEVEGNHNYIANNTLAHNCRIVKTKDGYFTRKNKRLSDEITNHLDIPLLDNVILDGELILPKEYTFQETISAIKKYGENTEKLEYYIFDAFFLDDIQATQSNRLDRLNTLNLEVGGKVNLLETVLVSSIEEFTNISSEFIAQGYEGSIYRNRNGIYQPNTRSQYLVKYKEFQDSEFLILDIVDGVGREVGCAIYLCRNDDGTDNTFHVRPKGSTEDRKVIFSNREEYIGKYLTVKYQERTDGNLPRFPVGQECRDFE